MVKCCSTGVNSLQGVAPGSATSIVASPPLASHVTGTLVKPTDSVPEPAFPVTFPTHTLICADLFATFGNTCASSIHTGLVAANSILPTMPFHVPPSASDTECPSKRY